MKISEAGLALIKNFEGCRLEAYRCPAGIPTIGWGSTEDVYDGMKITQEEADSRLLAHLDTLAAQVSKLLKRPVTQSQFDALVAFAYNVGVGNLQQSTLLRCLNLGHPEDAAQEFLKWDKAGGKVIAGLTRRRQAERELFLQA